jgi:signal transduction histidine kinase
MILGAVVYYSATSAIEDQYRSRIEAEASALSDIYASGGARALRAAITERESQRRFAGVEHALYDVKGKLIFGPIPGNMPKLGWSIVTGPPDGDEDPGDDEKLAVLVTTLPDGARLAVADDLNRSEELGEIIFKAFGVALILSVTLAIAGGALLSGLFLRRVDAITRAAEAIIEGNITHRITIRGTDDDLDHLAATLNRMLDRIGSRMEAMRQVTNDVAHDLRTPIGHLWQLLEEARRTSRSPQEMEAALERGIAETDSILETFTALLRIAQIETGSRRAGFRDVDLSELVEGVIQTFGPAAEDAGKTIRADILPGVHIEGDRELLTQMAVNIVENAIAHTQAGAVVEITLTANGTGQILTIADDGPGIPEGERERVFRRFYRLDRSRGTSGSGLGLSLVAAIAEIHGIAVQLANNNPGLRVTISLPLQA